MMNIHLGPVGERAISFGHENYNGGVNVERMAARGLANAAHLQPVGALQAPQVGLQASPAGSFGQAIGQNPANTPGLGAWNAEGVRTLKNMP